MGFGYKTSWIAVRDGAAAEVATALGLGQVVPMSWDEGTDRAYDQGVYVSAPVSGWVLAHGRDLGLDGDHADFLPRLADLSRALGEVCFFGTHRVSEYHAWALCRDGHVRRAYCIGDGQVHQFHGPVSEIEQALGVGTMPFPDDPGALGDSEWSAWWAAAPSEDHVMLVAGAWSLNPLDIHDVPDPGLYASARRVG
ncbi:hypothetical protein ACFQZ4_50930 [Catellatospora coxensis]|uniref:Uncharacterized protein n=1 Tax=Catellatospora coxensis TaxID=310354 RepID=A0A8J3KM08_9ACTN|nr:hypothetical protein [Catellatospora coxensis]GIG05033.1 hypothetical protein Cco03nite_17330 [Catellatospora coxensis]